MDKSLEAMNALRRSFRYAYELGATYMTANSIEELQQAMNEGNEIALNPPRPSRESELLDKLLTATLEYVVRIYEDRKEKKTWPNETMTTTS